MLLEPALKIAHTVQASLMEHCDITHIAGSCRRLKPDVGDIEVMCLPRKDKSFKEDIFATSEVQTVTKPFVNAVLSLGHRLKGDPGGRYMQILLPEGINLDLFMPEEYDYYRQLAIRTGPAEYSYAVLAVGWRKIGWCGTKDGLRLISDCREIRKCSGSSTWYCINPTPELPPKWKSEREFFDWIKVPWTEPARRG
jgi:hypothetical protein